MFKFKVILLWLMILGIGVFIGSCVTSFIMLDSKETSKPVTTNEFKESKESKKSNDNKDVKVPFEIINPVKGLKITVTKITNDKHLKIYVTYKNNSGASYELSESLHKIVADGKQQEHDTMRRLDLMNSEPLYEIEDTVEYDSVLIFDKLKVNKFNLVFNVNYNDIRVNNILINH